MTWEDNFELIFLNAPSNTGVGCSSPISGWLATTRIQLLMDRQQQAMEIHETHTRT